MQATSMRPAMVCRGVKAVRAMRSTTKVEPQKAMAVSKAAWGNKFRAVGDIRVFSFSRMVADDFCGSLW